MNVCLRCETPLTADEWLTGACPFCGAVVEDLAAQQRPGKVSALFRGDAVASDVKDRPGWATVRIGLGLYIIGIVAVWVASSMFAATQLVLNRLPTQSPLFVTLQWASLPVALWGGFTLITGYVLCAATPRTSGCRRWIWASMGLSVLAGGLVLAHNYMNVSNGDAVKARDAFRRFVGSTTASDSLASPIPSSLDDPWSPAVVKAVAITFLSVSFLAYGFHILFHYCPVKSRIVSTG